MSKGEVQGKDFSLPRGSWPSKVELTNLGTNAWGFYKIEICDGAMVSEYCIGTALTLLEDPNGESGTTWSAEDALLYWLEKDSSAEPAPLPQTLSWTVPTLPPVAVTLSITTSLYSTADTPGKALVQFLVGGTWTPTTTGLFATGQAKGQVTRVKYSLAGIQPCTVSAETFCHLVVLVIDVTY